jgi:hypothetical protein
MALPVYTGLITVNERITMDSPTWRKSTRCGTAACVEVATTDTGHAVRDSKDPDSPILAFGEASWAAFTAELKRGGLATA